LLLSSQRSPAFAKFAADMWMLPIFLCAAYVVFCFGGKRLMKDRLPFDLQWYVAAVGANGAVQSRVSCVHFSVQAACHVEPGTVSVQLLGRTPDGSTPAVLLEDAGIAFHGKLLRAWFGKRPLRLVHQVCEPAWNWYGYQASGLWTALFIYSKV